MRRRQNFRHSRRKIPTRVLRRKPRLDEGTLSAGEIGVDIFVIRIRFSISFFLSANINFDFCPLTFCPDCDSTFCSARFFTPVANPSSGSAADRFRTLDSALHSSLQRQQCLQTELCRLSVALSRPFSEVPSLPIICDGIFQLHMCYLIKHAFSQELNFVPSRRSHSRHSSSQFGRGERELERRAEISLAIAAKNVGYNGTNFLHHPGDKNQSSFLFPYVCLTHPYSFSVPYLPAERLQKITLFFLLFSSFPFMSTPNNCSKAQSPKI